MGKNLCSLEAALPALETSLTVAQHGCLLKSSLYISPYWLHCDLTTVPPTSCQPWGPSCAHSGVLFCVPTVHFVERVFYCKSSMDRTMMIRWSGLDCAHVLWKGLSTRVSRVSSPREPATRSTASEPSTSRSSSTRAITTWGPAEDADRSWRKDFKGGLLDYQRCVDGERGGQRSG